MKIITSDDFPITELSQIALDSKLYECPTWTLIKCYRDILYKPSVAKTSELILLKSNFGKYIGSIFHNYVHSHLYWGTNIQIFVKEEHRMKGYGKLLYTEMNNRLIKNKFDGILEAGCGTNGSLIFWDKMNDLNKEKSEQYLELATSTW
jgi:GNAT superfamily N-acetyltransferase